MKKMAIDPKKISSLIDSVIPQDQWVENAVERLIAPMFYTKTSAYGATGDQFHSIREIARRNFPKEYEDNEWYAMARVVGILVDKHHVALAKSPAVYENRDRAIDCVVYEFFRLRFIILGDELENSRALENIKRICEGDLHEHKECNCQGRCRELSNVNMVDKAS